MWFGSNPPFWPGEGIQLLAVSCVALVAALQVWGVRGHSTWMLRWSTVVGIALLLISIAAVEPVLFMEGHLIAVLALYGVTSVRCFGWASFRSPNVLAPAAVILLESIFALSRVDALYPWRWFGLGLGAGAAAAIIDFGMKRRRRWFLWAIGTGMVAIAVSYLAAACVGYGDLFGFYLRDHEPVPAASEREWFSNSSHLLSLGTLFYWLWRSAAHLACVVNPTPAGPKSSASHIQFGWSLLGTGIRRVARLTFVWPALFALSVFIFTPWLEAYIKLPPLPVVPPGQAGPNAFDELIAFPNELDWSMAKGEEGEFVPGSFEPFCRANRDRIPRLLQIVAKPCFPPISYAPLASALTIEQNKSIFTIREVLRSMQLQAQIDLDLEQQHELARITILSARPFRRGGLVDHHAHGRFIEEIAFRMAIEAHPVLNAEQCKSLITLLSDSDDWEDADEVVAARHANWLLAVRGWRQRLERACYDPQYFGYYVFNSLEREHRALRATLICELALRQYLEDHPRPAESLDDLVPKYLNKVPIDPFGGGKLQYHASGKLPIPYYAYSVGYNLRPDDGLPWGTPSPLEETKPDDISIAYWIREKWRENGAGVPSNLTISVEEPQDSSEPRLPPANDNQDGDEQNSEP